MQHHRRPYDNRPSRFAVTYKVWSQMSHDEERIEAIRRHPSSQVKDDS